MTARVIDAHLHLWHLGHGGYGWNTPERGMLHRDFLPGEAAVELSAAGVDAAILVQADNSAADTRFMLDVARRHDWVAGVVGWVPLEDQRTAAAALDDFRGEPLLLGIRHLVHDDPRDGFLDLPAVRASLELVAANGLPFDVPDAWPRHLPSAARLASAIPELTVIIDHLAKPPLDGDGVAAWEAQFRAIAELPNTVAKFSGLQVGGTPLTLGRVRALLHVALDAFGADRLMYGGDWPMSVPDGGYQPTWQLMLQCLDELSAGEREAVLGKTAERVYRLALPVLTPRTTNKPR